MTRRKSAKYLGGVHLEPLPGAGPAIVPDGPEQVLKLLGPEQVLQRLGPEQVLTLLAHYRALGKPPCPDRGGTFGVSLGWPLHPEGGVYYTAWTLLARGRRSVSALGAPSTRKEGMCDSVAMAHGGGHRRPVLAVALGRATTRSCSLSLLPAVTRRRNGDRESSAAFLGARAVWQTSLVVLRQQQPLPGPLADWYGPAS